MPTNEERIATVEVEVKLLKWIIPSAAGFIMLCLTIFFAVELKNLNARVKAVIEQSGLAAATKRIGELETAAKQSADGATRFAASAADASSEINKLSSSTDAFAEHLGMPAIRTGLESMQTALRTFTQSREYAVFYEEQDSGVPVPARLIGSHAI